MRKLFILIIGCLPFNFFRIFCYNLLPNYRIDYKSHIGWLNYIDCNECILKNSKIGFLNRIRVKKLSMDENAVISYANNLQYLNLLEMHRNSCIRSSNTILGCNQAWNPYKEFSVFKIGESSLLTSHHYMDATDSITMGANVVFGGIHSKVWTHGFDVMRTRIQAPVVIHDNVYVGAGSTILQGVEVASDTIIGASTVVSKSIKNGGFYISNQLVKKADCQSYGNREGVLKSGKAGYYRKIIE